MSFLNYEDCIWFSDIGMYQIGKIVKLITFKVLILFTVVTTLTSIIGIYTITVLTILVGYTVFI